MSTPSTLRWGIFTVHFKTNPRSHIDRYRLWFFLCVFFERRAAREDEVSAGRSDDDDDDDDDGRRRRETTTTARRVGRELGRREIDDGETRIGR